MMILDHGYIEMVKFWGSDEEIIETARMSTQKGFLGWWPMPCEDCGSSDTDDAGCGNHFLMPGDEKLLRYLWEHKHLSPFESAGATFEVQAPIFVFREWHRHRTQSYNEASARYSKLPDVNYVPKLERVLPGFSLSKSKQAASMVDVAVNDRFKSDAAEWIKSLDEFYVAGEKLYSRGLDIGIPKEIARLPVSVGRYSKMRASANLRNWLQFLDLRCSLDAQYEIRMYANAISELLEKNFPRTMELWREKRV